MPEHLVRGRRATPRILPELAFPLGAPAALGRGWVASAPPQPPNGPYQQGQRPPGPGQRPGAPGQRPGPPGPSSGPPVPPYGPGGRGPGGPGGYPPQSGGDGPFGSRRNLILAIVGGVVLIGAAIGIGFWLVRPDTTATPPVGQVSAPPVTESTTPSSPPTSTPSGSPSGTPSSTPTSSGGSTAPDALPAGPALGPNLIVVPMRTADDDEDTRPLYLVDAGGAGEPQKLDGPDGKLANPLLQKDRTSIAFLEDGTLHVMGSDGSGERDLADREPAGCDDVAGASWSQVDPSTMVISCRISKGSFRMLVVDTDGRLIRRLDAGSKRFDDVTISPDGQTVLYWASDSSVGDGGSLYTLPLVGTGSPKKITSGAKGLDGDASWSPDGSQIAFRRLVGGAEGNADVYVMNADGSAQRAVAETKAADVKPVWSPDGKNLMIASNRKSAFGKAGDTWDLWLTRVSDGEVLSNLDLEADELTTPTWTYR
jgi:dipeptidyl aminopeptidase/acylaminoacyl peptidase